MSHVGVTLCSPFLTYFLDYGRGEVADVIKSEVNIALSKNSGYEELEKAVTVMSGNSIVKVNFELFPADIVKLK